MSEADRYMALPYTIEVEPEERRHDAFHVARIAELEGCIAQGRTEAEARSELRDAQRLFIETMLENGVPVPEPRSSRRDSLAVQTELRSKLLGQLGVGQDFRCLQLLAML